MHPLTFLAATLLLTLAAYAVNQLARHRAAGRVRRLAAQWRMNYSEVDRFQITPRVVERFPIPGASNVKVIDLIYRRDENNRFRYYFTVHYTAGVIRTKRRLRRAATLSEPRDPRAAAAAGWSALLLAPEHLPLLEQYRHLGPDASEAGAAVSPLQSEPVEEKPVEARGAEQASS